MRFEVKFIPLFCFPWPQDHLALGRFFSHLPARQAPLAVLYFQSYKHVHPRCGHGSRQVGQEPEESRADWDKETGKQEWAAVKKKWWRTGVNRRFWGEHPRLKPREANIWERSRVKGYRGQDQGNWDFSLVLSRPWGPPQTSGCTSALPQPPQMGGKWSWAAVIIQHRNL